MQEVALWQIDPDASEAAAEPLRLHESFIELEKKLEDWIEANPDLVEQGLRIVGRQVQTVAGPVDLIGRDPQGRWTIIEIKRAQPTRLALAQAIDYASALAELSNEELTRAIAAHPAKQTGQASPAMQLDESPSEREVRIILVGAGREQGLQRIVNFLAKFQLPISVVAFSVFQVAGAGHLLLRELTESEGALANAPSSMPSHESHVQTAMSHGIGDAFSSIIETATKLGLGSKSFKRCVMLAPPHNRNRALFTVWDTPDEPGKVTVWLGTEPFERAFEIPQEEVTKLLGPGEWRRLSADEVQQFVSGLKTLLSGAVEQDA